VIPGRCSAAPARALLLLILGAAAALSVPQCRAAAAGEPGYAWNAPSWRLQLRTTTYGFQTVDPSGPDLDHLGGYQEFDGAVSGLVDGHLTVRAAGRFADDLWLKERTTTRERLYTGHVEGRLGSMLTARLGRQFVQEGPTGLTLDGLWLALRPSAMWGLRVFGGARAPLSRKIEAGTLGDDPAWGARVTCAPLRQLQLAASYAYRETAGRIATRPLGLEAGLTPWPGLRGTGRLSYDLQRERWDRAEALAQWQPRRNLPVLSAQVIDRAPAIDDGSYFARFVGAAERLRLARCTLRYEHRTRMGAELEYVGSFVDERTATRLGAALLFPYGQVGYSARIGDAGEESSWYGFLRWLPVGWLSLDGGATLSTYALLQDAPDSDQRDLTTIYARARARVRDGLRVSAEVQSLDNPVYSKDVRLLLGVDVDMGRGASRFGLDQGGWLR
jgi:hypothetical protein